MSRITMFLFRIRIRFFLTSVLLMLVLFPSVRCSAHNFANEKEQLVEAILARSEMFFSGRMKYHLKFGFANTGKIIGDSDCEFSFSGNSWVLRFQGGGVSSSHKGKFIKYTLYPQPNGSIDRVASIEIAKPMDENQPYPPFFAGSFWYKTTRESIRANLHKVQLSNQKLPNGWPKAQALEWAVPAQNISEAFDHVTELSRLRAPGILRIFVAPELGYVLPRVEHISKQNNGEEIDAIFDATDFRKVAEGIYLPFNMTQQTFGKNGKLLYYSEYKIAKAVNINEPIPDSDFTVWFEKGTIIHDARSPKSVISFRVGQEEITSSDIMDKVQAQAKRDRFMTWKVAIGLGTFIAIFILIIARVIIWRVRAIK